MPEKSIQISSLTVGVGSIISITMVFASAYLTVVLKNVNQKIDRIKDQIQDIKETLKHQREMHEDHYNRIHDVEKIQAVMKSEHDINHKR